MVAQIHAKICYNIYLALLQLNSLIIYLTLSIVYFIMHLR